MKGCPRCGMIDWCSNHQGRKEMPPEEAMALTQTHMQSLKRELKRYERNLQEIASFCEYRRNPFTKEIMRKFEDGPNGTCVLTNTKMEGRDTYPLYIWEQWERVSCLDPDPDPKNPDPAYSEDAEEALITLVEALSPWIDHALPHDEWGDHLKALWEAASSDISLGVSERAKALIDWLIGDLETLLFGDFLDKGKIVIAQEHAKRILEDSGPNASVPNWIISGELETKARRPDYHNQRL